MNKWLAMHGNFEEKNKTIIYKGGIIAQNQDEQRTPNINPLPKAGLLIFEDTLTNGTIEMTTEFEKLEEKEEAQIVFNYLGENNFMCAGINNNLGKYELKYFDGKWHFEKINGFSENLPNKKYNIKIVISGSLITLFIENIKVFTYLSKIPIKKGNIGIWTCSKNDITISNYVVQNKQPQAFVISQFGGDYDVLYEDVIKPVCNEQFIVKRADEMNRPTPIINDITESIRNSTLVIADITPNNPNVFYEVGYAHGINKPTILLCEKSRSVLPFDVSGFRTIFYDNSIGGKKIVEEKLKQYIDNIVNNIS